MPLSKYDQYFGGHGKAEKAHAAMEKTYKDPEKADEVFYALKNKRKSKMRGPTTKDAARALMAH